MTGTTLYSLAIETSSHRGSIALGCADALIEVVDLPEARRHNVVLTPTIDRLFRRHDLEPAALEQVYLSIGPGSFTGLRVAVATAKAMALARGVRLVAVPTLDVLAAAAPPPPADRPEERLAIGLNLKKDTLYTGIYTWDGQRWEPAAEPALRTLEQLRGVQAGPLAVLADPLPDDADAMLAASPHLRRLEPALAIPHASSLWPLGHQRAREGGFTDPATLTPLYARPPEAVQRWQQRQQRDRAGAQ